MRIYTKETFLIKRQNIMEEQATYNRKFKYDVVIGIDPDVERSGLAILGLYDMKLTVNSHPFPELLEIVRSVAFEGAELGHATVVYVEAGWKNKSNWHLSPKDTRASAAKKGEHHHSDIPVARFGSRYGSGLYNRTRRFQSVSRGDAGIVSSSVQVFWDTRER